MTNAKNVEDLPNLKEWHKVPSNGLVPEGTTYFCLRGPNNIPEFRVAQKAFVRQWWSQDCYTEKEIKVDELTMWATRIVRATDIAQAKEVLSEFIQTRDGNEELKRELKRDLIKYLSGI